MKDRIDKMMVTKGIVVTRSQARMLIVQGDVFCNDAQVTKPGMNVSDTDKIEVKGRSLYVSRGAYKLEKAIESFGINPKDKICADIGASTGGFTQILLINGAKKVYAVDVGHDQLAQELRETEQVINMEGVNIKHPLELPEKVDLIVVDLSFISLRLVFENIYNLLAEKGEIAVLIKPQFEVGREGLGKNGIVKDDVTRAKGLDDVLEWMKEKNYKVDQLIESPIHGKTGNTEYLAYVIKE